jgi:hypothetical protein
MELSRMRPEVLRTKAAIVVTLLVLSPWVGGQSSPPFPEGAPLHFQLSKYVNQTLAFELSYPSRYHPSESPVPSPPSYREQWEVLLYATTGSGQARCEDEGECDKFGRMIIALDRRRFDLQAIERYYAHTGWSQPVSFHVDGNTFYWYGPGGGGVTYPDTFLYDLNGRILIFEFDGPYTPDSKSPSEETKGIEKVVLQSFRSRGKPRPGN